MKRAGERPPFYGFREFSRKIVCWGSRFHYSETSDGLEVFTEALFFHPIDEITGIFFSIDARGRSKPRRVVDEYGAQIRLRRLVRSDWLYLEVAPRVAFPEENLTNRRGPTKTEVHLLLHIGVDPGAHW